MKKIFLFIILFFSISNVYAITGKENINVTLNKCIDGDTASFKYNDKIIKVRFLAVDTPESTKEKEEYGIEASNFTCDKLTSAKEIIIEFDKNSDLQDKYDRYLGWIFIDGVLLQDEIIKNGLGEVAYLYDDYKYTDILKKSELKAKQNKIGIWKNHQIIDYRILIIIFLIIILLCIISPKIKKVIKRKVKKEIKKKITQ